ncbi:MAG: Smr/MutS family protein [Burkholderiaceae bacterium]
MSRYKSLAELTEMRRTLFAESVRQKARAEAATRAAEIQAREDDLFRKTVGPVIPLPASTRMERRAAPTLPWPRHTVEDERRVLHESLSDEMDVERLLDTDDQLSFRRNGIGSETVRQLRRGKWSLQTELDLHGLRVDEARVAVNAFLHDCLSEGIRCVRIIHGKGNGSPGKQAVLRDKVRRWLVQSDPVLAFCQATAADGGSGALLVLLRSGNA